MFASVLSMGVFGMEAYMVNVEIDISSGMPSFDIVGLPDTAVKESRDRVRSAIKNSGYEFPLGKIVVNLAPADTKKTGSVYDLPIFIGILSASGQIPKVNDDCAFVGELSLGGEVNAVNGALPMAMEAGRAGVKKVFAPADNAYESSVVEGVDVLVADHVQNIAGYLLGKNELKIAKFEDKEIFSERGLKEPPLLDFSDVKGQRAAKRALEIAAAGGHNILMIGAPGSGKSMLAKRLPSILPDMSYDEWIETTKIHSVAGLLTREAPIVAARPFRSPHHTVSAAGMSGGGTIPRPGEISLAHNGVLFLDELPEFGRNALEVLRQPLEDGYVTISRASGRISYPCNVMFVAAMNPCPCGYFGHPSRNCSCSKPAIERYLSRISGPLLDRIDIHIDVLPVEFRQLSDDTKEESSAAIKERVDRARKIQLKRFAGQSVHSNAKMTSAMEREFCKLDTKASGLLEIAFERMGFSARAYDKVIRVARTIADLDGSEDILAPHISEAIQYRSLDRKYWSER